MHARVLLSGIASLCLLSACTPDEQRAINDIIDNDGGGCVIAGCSGQLCIEEGDDGVSTCEWREEYGCYADAKCERQADGACGWTMTDALTSCLENPPSMIGDDQSIGIAGCSNDADCAAGQTCSIACTQSQCSTDGNCAENCHGQCVDHWVRTAYSGYSPEVLMNGQTKVLFFHAAWCPTCRQADETLREMYNKWDEESSVAELMKNLPKYSVYKVDYDTEKDLKARYGVTYQHTFVLVDGEGNALNTVQGPSDAALKDLIGAQS